MGYRIVVDEHIELPTRRYLRKLGHDVVWIGDDRELGLSATDEAIAADSLAGSTGSDTGRRPLSLAGPRRIHWNPLSAGLVAIVTAAR